MAGESCRLCGSWECADCGHKGHGKNRFFEGQHYCSRCRSTDGRMLPVRHHSPKRTKNHNEDADEHGEPTYPLTARPAAGPDA